MHGLYVLVMQNLLIFQYKVGTVGKLKNKTGSIFSTLLRAKRINTIKLDFQFSELGYVQNLKMYMCVAHPFLDPLEKERKIP